MRRRPLPKSRTNAAQIAQAEQQRRPDMNRIDRRQFIAGASALMASLPMFRVSPALAQALKITMGAGLAQEPGALVMKMQQDKLLEQAAQELGVAGIEAEYLAFPV